jgi:hypothetical protein
LNRLRPDFPGGAWSFVESRLFTRPDHALRK